MQKCKIILTKITILYNVESVISLCPYRVEEKRQFIFLQLLQFSNQIQDLVRLCINNIVRLIKDLRVSKIQRMGQTIFLFQGSYFEICKRLNQIQFIFNRIPSNLQYQVQKNWLSLFYITNFAIYQIFYYFFLRQGMKERIIEMNESHDKFTQCLFCDDNTTNVTCTQYCIMQQINLKQQCLICRQNCQVQQLIQLYDYN
ncbi:unnamed protein product (macronuclear) [Paramecium tetraurelia]|uniref:Pex N-terminal domain-containing protein n=1 Tax=Paramecium tetraurelia TaxID=5888 RepID=A0E5V7_PARTE|nr:uncharacterized protein GSPATT00003537001 [Paramecium tetraurelia]CAK90674.1 unnamed protein product [Paramecium tetraurelia]|eukprot:XP_001458071.1 hypothetical protein (macronuclear) [Paramecium tetraurelia strain d4-2]